MPPTRQQPSVSVVLPFRDAATTLAEAIDSVRAQTFGDLECILIDNQSRDESRAIAQSLTHHDPRLNVLESDGGLVDALNAGIAAAQAPWIARMDADDLCHPRRLEQQLALLSSDPTLTIASCLVECFPRTELRDGMRRYEAWLNSVCEAEDIRNALFVESPLPHPSVVVARSALEAVGGYRDTKWAEDYDLWMRLILAGHRAAKVPEVLVQWRDSARRLTRVDPRYAPERFVEMKLHYLPEVVPPARPLQICGAGPIGRHWAKQLQRRGYRIARFIDVDPRKVGRKAGGIPIESLSQLDPAGGFVLAAVGTVGAREDIDAWLRGRGLRPWEDYLALA